MKQTKIQKWGRTMSTYSSSISALSDSCLVLHPIRFMYIRKVVTKYYLYFGRLLCSSLYVPFPHIHWTDFVLRKRGSPTFRFIVRKWYFRLQISIQTNGSLKCCSECLWMGGNLQSKKHLNSMCTRPSCAHCAWSKQSNVCQKYVFMYFHTAYRGLRNTSI